MRLQVRRQKWFTLGGQDLFIDQVLYDYILQGSALFDLKTGKLPHQYRGQMQMYVNCFKYH